MPKSRHRKTQKQRSSNRTVRLKQDLERYKKQMMEEQMKLMEQAKEQRESNLKKEEDPQGETYGFSPKDSE